MFAYSIQRLGWADFAAYFGYLAIDY